MIDIATLAAEKYAKYSIDLAGLSVNQIDKLKSPTGILGGKAWDKVRFERLNEERAAVRKAKLLEMFPTITDEQLEVLDIEDEPNNQLGIVVRFKTDTVKLKDKEVLDV